MLDEGERRARRATGADAWDAVAEERTGRGCEDRAGRELRRLVDDLRARGSEQARAQGRSTVEGKRRSRKMKLKLAPGRFGAVRHRSSLGRDDLKVLISQRPCSG